MSKSKILIIAIIIFYGYYFLINSFNRIDYPKEISVGEIANINKLFSSKVEQNGVIVDNYYNQYFTSYYDRASDMDFNKFIEKFTVTDENLITEKEFTELKKLKNFPYKDIENLKLCPKKIYGLTSGYLDNILTHDMGIKVYDLDTKEAFYLEEHDSFYIIESDEKSIDNFVVKNGYAYKDTYTLYSKDAKLFLKRKGHTNKYQIVSYNESDGMNGTLEDLNKIFEGTSRDKVFELLGPPDRVCSNIRNGIKDTFNIEDKTVEISYKVDSSFKIVICHIEVIDKFNF